LSTLLAKSGEKGENKDEMIKLTAKEVKIVLFKLIIDYKGDLDNFSLLLQKVYYEHNGANYIFCSEDGSQLVTNQDVAISFANFANECGCDILDALEASRTDIENAEKTGDDPERVYQFIASSFYTGYLDGDLLKIYELLGFSFDSWDQTGLSGAEIFALCEESLEA
jgi:hypothetical protein